MELQLLEDESGPIAGTDYVNANLLTNEQGKPWIIAAQGPLPHTVDDFWRCVWEKNVHVIVMVCNVVEAGRAKCAQYWPTTAGELQFYGGVGVTLCSEEQVLKE